MKSAEGEAGDPHPLSPLSPTLARRSSATSLPPAGPSRTPASYFELPKDDPPRRHHATSLTSRHSRKVSGITEADLLGVGPSQRPFRPPGQTSNKPSPPISQLALMETANETNVSAKLRPIPRRGASSGSRPWSVYVESLRREEIGVVETRFDLMTDEELDAYLGQYGQALSTPSLATPRKPPDKTVSTSPTTPRAPRGAQSVRSKGADVDDEDKSPLFPPSPPRHAAKSQVLDHPLRILSRAIRELQVAVQRLEEENDRLRAPGATSSSPVIAQKAADRVSHKLQALLTIDIHP